jgi:hypothetical protein
MTSFTLRIPFQAENFPAGTASNWPSELPVTWDDILWAAITVGRPNRNYVFRHGDASVFEAIFRWSLVRMALEQSSLRSYRLHRTEAAKTLDPTEKGTVNYFLGMIFCKLFASKLLNISYLLHLDVFRPRLDVQLKGRSRPDLIGKDKKTNQWHAFECKGRISKPDSKTKTKAKDQAMRLISVDGNQCQLHIGAITYFNNDALNFYWRDPVPDEKHKIYVQVNDDDWRYYYSPIVELFSEKDRKNMLENNEDAWISRQDFDIEVKIHRALKKYLFHSRWSDSQRVAEEAAEEIAEDGYQPDGLLIKAGPTWNKRFEDLINEG